MTLRDIVEDIHLLTEDLATYERKYGILSETFHRAYSAGEEPEDDSWVLDWADWAGAYQTLLRRRAQYESALREMQGQSVSLGEVIGKAARRETVPVPA